MPNCSFAPQGRGLDLLALRCYRGLLGSIRGEGLGLHSVSTE
ncbi:hypothetical protein HMPREF9134_01025 [Porphyromonas catoniae F0037]|uniref:Uncharacterized protein n=1 Tax=Porphyromonas catoniae F0037 TaxID=1127696 RepID=L1NDG0_9PORP|nr:hypothetical protein HMPREF9134_01025 [Porphyromonas catoniae F0037]